MKNFFKLQVSAQVLQVVVLTILIGFLAGIVGNFVTDAYSNPWQENYGNIVNNPDQELATPELHRIKRFLGIEQDFEVVNALQQIRPSTIGIYLKKAPSDNPTASIYAPSDLLANGTIVTSDGWIVTNFDPLTTASAQNYLVFQDKESYDIEAVIKDDFSQMTFLKITARNLPVAAFGDAKELNSGQLVVAVNSVNQVLVSSIENNHLFADPLLTAVTEKSGYVLQLAQSGFNESYIASPLTNLAGEVIGIISEVGENGEAKVVPINHFRTAILDVLRTGEITRPMIGLSYLDLSWIRGVGEDIIHGRRHGALVVKSPASDSPAASAIKINDIVISVENQMLDEDLNLTEIIQQYKPGDSLTLELLREGELTTVEVILQAIQ